MYGTLIGVLFCWIYGTIIRVLFYGTLISVLFYVEFMEHPSLFQLYLHRICVFSPYLFCVCFTKYLPRCTVLSVRIKNIEILRVVIFKILIFGNQRREKNDRNRFLFSSLISKKQVFWKSIKWGGFLKVLHFGWQPKYIFLDSQLR